MEETVTNSFEENEADDVVEYLQMRFRKHNDIYARTASRDRKIQKRKERRESITKFRNPILLYASVGWRICQRNTLGTPINPKAAPSLVNLSENCGILAAVTLLSLAGAAVLLL